jgi:glucosamine--fructose-6-phosphate aminotransferase (isomerizing)
MSQRGEHTYQEIMSQPEAWAEAIEVGHSAQSALNRLWQESGARDLLFTGCGSTYYLSLAAAAVAREAGLAARAMPASEVWLFPHLTGGRPGHSLLVAVSRSGETSETLHAVEAFRHAKGKTAVAVTCYPSCSLAQRCDATLAVPGAQEVSVAQTRSFDSMLILCQMLVGALTREAGSQHRLDALPDLGRRLIESYGWLAANLGEQSLIQRFFFLGNGPRYGLACEAMLKMKEMALSHSEAYHTLEFRHGPKSMVNEETLVIGLLSDEARTQESAVLAEMKQLGGRTLVLTDGGGAVQLGGADYQVRLESGLPESDRLVLYLPILQLLAYYRGMANGQDPDRPRNLTSVVVL